jgi:hypothetical protein
MDEIVEVALDTTAEQPYPEVVVIPRHAPADQGQIVRWTKIGNEYFTFHKFTPIDPNAIKLLKLTDDEIIAQYSDQGAHLCEYTIVVLDSNGGTHDTIARGTIGSGGGPTIKNK